MASIIQYFKLGLGKIYRNLYIAKRKFVQGKVNTTNPIFVVGTQGCGATIINRVLSSAPEIVYCFGNSKHRFYNDEMQNALYNELPETFRLGTRKQKKQRVPSFENETADIFATDAMIHYYRKDETDYDAKEVRALKQAMGKSIKAFGTKYSRFIDKSQSYGLKIPLLRKIFPKVKFVVVTRDPYAICTREIIKEDRIWAKGMTQKEKAATVCNHWKNYHEEILKHKGNDMFFIRIEDFVQNPEQYSKQLKEFLELKGDIKLPSKQDKVPLGSNMRGKWYEIKKDINKKYYTKLSSALAKEIQHNLGVLAAKEFKYKNPKP